MRLIDADKLKKAIQDYYLSCALDNEVYDIIDNAPTVKTYCYFCGQTEHGQIEERPQDKWFDCISEGTLKARHGDYVLYKVDFLLNNLTREVYIMEGARRQKGGAE